MVKEPKCDLVANNSASSWVTPEFISSSSKSAKENDTHELTYKIHKTNSQTWKSNSLVAKGEMPRGGIKQEIEINRYTLLYMK